MDTILYLYARQKTVENEHRADSLQAKTQPERSPLFSGLWKYSLGILFSGGLFHEKHAHGSRKPVQIKRTEYLFPDYRLVKIAVVGSDDDRAEQSLSVQLQELTEDPDHTYVVCREPLSFYFGREFREYGQQDWVEHLLRYGETTKRMPIYPDLIIFGKNTYLPYVILRYACGLKSMKWYLTDREYREEEEWLTEELEDEYGLIAELHLLREQTDYAKVRLNETSPHLVLDFCNSEKIYGGGLPTGSVWLDFAAMEEKERRLSAGCTQIRYFSLKKEWQDPRKALEYLDIISKNGYNNPVD